MGQSGTGKNQDGVRSRLLICLLVDECVPVTDPDDAAQVRLLKEFPFEEAERLSGSSETRVECTVRGSL
jgi:hypothetical protein